MEYRTQRLSRIMGAITVALFLGSMFLMTGCGSLNPYAEYQHLSDPRIAHDGYDLMCGGAQHATRGLTFHAGVCKDVTGTRGEYINAGVRYVMETAD